jgi:hypothetical protein
VKIQNHKNKEIFFCFFWNSEKTKNIQKRKEKRNKTRKKNYP